MLYAHYYKANKKQFVLICDNILALNAKLHHVENKKQARQLAKQLNAKPWNF